MQLKTILNRVERQKGFVYTRIRASSHTREVAPFAVAAERNAPDTTREEKGGSSLYRCGVSRCFFFTR